MKTVLLLGFAVLLFNPDAAFSQQADPTKPDETELSIEEIMNMEVTSAAKREQKVSDATVAISIITREDIRRSGATSVADALRMVPGLNVAQIDSNKWAVTSRGFNGRFANKLLVLIDGRSVYTPLFSGVFWDVQDMLLEDIERIEVIRGPGAALWGANAVNGVINIISRSATDTQGTLVYAGGGSEEKAFGGIRFGGKAGDETYYRVYGKYFDRDELADASGRSASDAWDVARGGFRIDHLRGSNDLLTLHGDLYDGSYGGLVGLATLGPPYLALQVEDAEVSGGNLLGRWNRIFAGGSELALQVYYDRTERNDRVHRETRDTADVDYQHHLPLSRRQDVVWGAGYRWTSDEIDPTFNVAFTPKDRQDDLVSAFIQDDITLVPASLRLTIGSKLEWNDYTGFEIQPNLRILWNRTESQTIWAGVSRAVRTPSRFEHDSRLNTVAVPGQAGLTNLVSVFGDDDYESEELVASELGFRIEPTLRLSFDIATFYNVYDNLQTFEPGAPFVETDPLPPHVVVPLRPDNLMEGETYGIELVANWSVSRRWKLTASGSWLDVQLHLKRTSLDANAEAVEANSPTAQAHLRSFVDLPRGFKFDTIVYYVDDVPNQNVESYTRIDVRLGWEPTDRFGIGLVLQNLTDDQHPEFGPSFLVSPTQVERSGYAKLTWRF